MPGNADQAIYEVDGIPMKDWEDFDAQPEGGASVPRKTINPNGESTGYAHGQKPTWRMSHKADIVEGGEEFDYDSAMENKTQHTIREKFSAFAYIYVGCVLQPSGHGTDTETKGAKRNCEWTARKRYKVI